MTLLLSFVANPLFPTTEDENASGCLNRFAFASRSAIVLPQNICLLTEVGSPIGLAGRFT
jgi:hypothetical protein